MCTIRYACMCIILLLVLKLARDEEIKWCLECLLWIVEQRLPAIPASCTESAWRINQPGECQWNDLIGSIAHASAIHFIRFGIVLNILAANPSP